MKRGEAQLKRSVLKAKPSKPRKPLARAAPPKPKMKAGDGHRQAAPSPQSPREGWAMRQDELCALCGVRARARHHVTYAQEVRRRGGDLYAQGNGLAICFRCHERHHSAAARIALAVLPEAALDFAFALLGPYAHDYLARRYAGEDPRILIRLRADEGPAAGTRGSETEET